MRTRIALVLTLLASVVWVLAVPLWIVRYAAFEPAFYQAWLRQSDAVAGWKAALATALPHRIPEALWIPWLPRSPAMLHIFLNHLLPTAETESILSGAGPWLAAWAAGESDFIPRIAPEVVAPLRGPRGDTARAMLWETLPACDVAVPPACLPPDANTHASLNQTHSAWWQTFVDELGVALEIAEVEMTAVRPGLPPWFRWMWYAPLFAAALIVVAALVMPSGRTRWACVSIPLLTGGLIVGGVGVAAMFGLIPPPVLRAVPVTPFGDAALAIYPRAWSALLGILGPLAAMAAAVSLALGLAFIPLIFEGWTSKVVAVTGVLLALWGMMPIYPRSLFTGVSLLPVSTLAPTPTPWPTPTATPTLTPTPHYWPVAPGTPVPTPAGTFAAGAQLLGCVQAGDAPVLSLAADVDSVTVLQAQWTSTFALPALSIVRRTANAAPPDVYALSPSGRQIAVARDIDLYVYNFPAWTRALRSRVSTFSRIQKLVYTAGDEYLVLGLENGYLWVVRPATGGLEWLIPAHDGPVVALAAHPARPWVLSAGEDGALHWWDMATGKALGSLSGGDTGIAFLAFAPDNNLALSVDVGGEWTLWDLPGQRVVRRRVLLPGDGLTALAWLPDHILGGTQNGELVFVDDSLALTALPVAGQPVAAFAVSEAGYALVVSEAGELCVWGVLALR